MVHNTLWEWHSLYDNLAKGMRNYYIIRVEWSLLSSQEGWVPHPLWEEGKLHPKDVIISRKGE